MNGGIGKLKGAILEKGEEGYTYFKKIFRALGNVQKQYNWLISDCEACPKSFGHSIRIAQLGKYAWISGEELTGIVEKDNFQWVWVVLSGFEKQYTVKEVLEYELPYADGYKGFWKEAISIQHPLASIEMVAWDASCTLLISREESIIEDFRMAFPLSKDLSLFNKNRFSQPNELLEYEKWLKNNN